MTGDLLERARRGDEVAFAELIERDSNRLLLLLRREAAGALGGDFDLEDAFQLVVFRAWTRLPEFEPRGSASFYAWLVQIARNTLGNRFHYLKAKGRRQAQRAAGPAGAWTELSQEVAESMTSIATSAARRELAARLDRAVDALDADRRRLVELVYLGGTSLRAAAAELGIPTTTAWKQMQSALAELRRTMPEA